MGPNLVKLVKEIGASRTLEFGGCRHRHPSCGERTAQIFEIDPSSSSKGTGGVGTGPRDGPKLAASICQFSGSPKSRFDRKITSRGLTYEVGCRRNEGRSGVCRRRSFDGHVDTMTREEASALDGERGVVSFIRQQEDGFVVVGRDPGSKPERLANWAFRS
jgi:hypothetical protein